MRGRLLLLVVALFVAHSGATAYAGLPAGQTVKNDSSPAADQLGTTVVRVPGLKASDTIGSAMQTEAASQSQPVSITELWLTVGIVVSLGAAGVALQRRHRLRSDTTSQRGSGV